MTSATPEARLRNDRHGEHKTTQNTVRLIVFFVARKLVRNSAMQAQAFA